MYLIFDTETTGLPRNYSAPLTDFDNWPRLVQLAWQLHGPKGELIHAQNFIVKPDGFTIPFNSEKVHGISTERALKEGEELKKVLEHFSKDLQKTQLLVGHNIEFDLNITGAEYLRTRIESNLLELQSVDTKNEATDFVAIPGGPGGKFKWPTLTELHQKLFGEGFGDAHDAAYDVDATARCFFGLIKENIIEPFDGTSAEEITYEAPELAEANFQKSQTKHKPETLDPQPVIKPSAVIPFSHLHVHSQFSVLQSTASVKNIVAKAKELGMPAVAITDLGNMFGAFYAAQAADENIKVILGCEVYVAEERLKHKFTKDDPDRRFSQVLLAKNTEGFKNLTALSSVGYTEGFYAGVARVDKELIKKYADGLIALSGGLAGELPDLILNRGEHEAEEALKWWLEVFGNDFYIELNRHNTEEEDRANEVLIRLARKYNVKLIASNNVFYINKEDAEAHDALLCVKNAEYMSTPIGRGRGYRFGFPNDEFYLKSTEEMNELFRDLPEALENTAEIVAKTEQIKLSRDVLLPDFPIPDDFSDADEYLKYLSFEGAKSSNKYGEITDEVKERLDLELSVIKKMGFAGYFLITADLINAGREMNVMIGPGRGSAAGSAVAYCIGITSIDPLRYNLLFERFLNPERISMPDIDTDFDDEGRQKVIDYVVEKYGFDRVAHIITFGTMAAKMAIRDVSRVMELPLPEADALAKMVPERPGITLIQAFKENSELANIAKGTDLRGRVMREAKKLEGSVRNTGIHAAGVIIAPDALTEFIPVSASKDTDLWVTQYDGKVIEDAGMLKMDFLGLKTLTIIKTAVELIKKNRGTEVDIENIPEDDLKTFELYQRGDTIGTFQFESDGMRQYLKDLKPTDIEDLIAMNALYRPGPMQFIPNFINRKHGKEKVEYPHPLLEGILKNSYGIMVYQEQIMQTAQILAGYTLGSADILRRAMGKKKQEEMDKQRDIFIKGAGEKNDIPKEQAEEIFGIMEKFAAYGFNRSHSAAYSVVAYRTAYLKANFPAEYMAAVLTHNMSNIDKVTFFMDECRKQGIPVLGPDVNESNIFFDVNKEHQIRFGLGAVKGAGESAALAIISEREKNGPYSDLFDLAGRVDLRSVNKKTMECMAQAGAFDCFEGTHRAQYLVTPDAESSTAIETAIKFGHRKREEENASQQSLFGGSGDFELPVPKMPQIEPWGDIEKLRLEKEVVGFYISGHPLDRFSVEITHFCTCTVDKVDEYRNSDIAVAGIVTRVNIRQSKAGKPFALFSVEDYGGTLDMALFGEEYLRLSHFINIGEFIFIKGKVQERYNSAGRWELRPSEMKLLADVRDQLAKIVHIDIDLSRFTADAITSLEKAVSDHAGGRCDLRFSVSAPQEKMTIDMFSRKLRVDPNDQFINILEETAGIKYRIGSA